MTVGKDQILRLLRSRGHGDQANYAREQLPDVIDTRNPEHAALLSRYGLDPATLGDQLGDLGKLS